MEGSFIARRKREVVVKNNKKLIYELAYFPVGSDFPAVVKVVDDVFGIASAFAVGELIRMMVVETPVYGDKLAVAVESIKG